MISYEVQENGNHLTTGSHGALHQRFDNDNNRVPVDVEVLDVMFVPGLVELRYIP